MKQPQWTVHPSAAGQPLLDFLSGELGISRRRAKGLLDNRSVFVNDRRVWMARHALRAGDRVQVNLPADAAGAPAIPILYQDDAVVVADKPAGRLSNGTDSVESDLRASLPAPALEAVHRLDRDTTGCLIFARDPAATAPLVQQFRDQAVTKIYRAIVRGIPSPPQGVYARPIDGKTAHTEYRVVSSGAAAAQVWVRIGTGRTHQIRRHFAAAGHPVAGDSVYATAAIRDPMLKALPRQMLHAFSIRFSHPFTGAVIEARAPLPADFRQALKQLRLR